MNSYLNNKAKYEASVTSNTTIVAKKGIVTGFNPGAWTIDVLFYPLTSEDGNDAGAVQVPLASSWVGNGWGLYCAPPENIEAVVLYESGDLQIPIGINFIFSGETQPIQGVSSGEAWLVHQSGSFIKLNNDGKLLINGNTEIDITTPTLNVTTTGAININAGTIATIQATAEINLQAPVVNVSENLVITNNLSANNGQTTMDDGVFNAKAVHAQEDVTAAGISLDSHVHSGVQNGSGSTNPPT
jgi:phage baseplate assembly protein V